MVKGLGFRSSLWKNPRPLKGLGHLKAEAHHLHFSKAASQSSCMVRAQSRDSTFSAVSGFKNGSRFGV